MLKRFWVDNFKTLINVEFRPQGMNLLIGKNNSGKTNLCEAIRFVSATALLPLHDAAAFSTRNPWNLPNVYFDKPTIDFKLECELSAETQPHRFVYELGLGLQESRNGNGSSRRLALNHERLTVSGDGFENVDLIRNDEGEVQLLHERRYAEKRRDFSAQDSYVSTTAPTDTTMLHRLYDLQTNRLANRFKSYLLSWAYYSLNPAQMTSPKMKLGDSFLFSDGSNLSNVLYSLHNWNPELMHELVDAIRHMEPQLRSISFFPPDPENVYAFLSDGRGNKFSLSSASDGTLRYMALWYLILTASQVRAGTGVPPALLIEQPEDGLYVGHLKPLLQGIDPSGRQGQFIFTSHNPYFIDLFDSVPEGVHLMTRIGGTHSQLKTVDKAVALQRLDSLSLGEQHYREMLR